GVVGSVKVTVAVVSPLVGALLDPLRKSQSNHAVSAAPVGARANQSLGLPGPFVTPTLTVAPGATVTGVLPPLSVRLGPATTDRGRGGGVAGGIARHSGQRMRAAARGGRVPRGRIRRRGVFRAQVHPVQLELHPDDAHVVGGAGRDHDRARDWGARSGRGNRD